MNRPLRSHRSFVSRSLGFEQLQERTVLAGNVSAFVANGVLNITGDSGDNQVGVFKGGANGQISIVPLGGEAINKQPGTVVLSAIKGLNINLAGGKDLLQIGAGINLNANQFLSINMGDGDDDLQFDQLIAKGVNAFLGQGNDKATMINSTIDTSLYLLAGDGNDRVAITDSTLSGQIVLDGGLGGNSLALTAVNLKRGSSLLNFATKNIGSQRLKANDDLLTLNEGQQDVAVSVLGNDVATNGANLIASSITVTQPSHGSVTIFGRSGAITYNHNGDEAASDSFTYTIKDSTGASSTASVNITVNPVNDPPILADDSRSVSIGKTIKIQVLKNDTDADGTLDPSSVVITSQTLHGAAVVNPDGTISYTENGGAVGSDSFSYTVKDNKGLQTASPALVSISIVPVNQGPTVRQDFAAVLEGGSATFSPLANDTDSDGIDASSLLVLAPDFGEVKVNSDFTATYTHDGSLKGSGGLGLFYQVLDNLGNRSANGLVFVSVAQLNDAPIAVPDSYNAARNGKTVIDPYKNDTDEEDGLDIKSIAIVAQPSHGAAIVNSDGNVEYTNDNNSAATDSFTYKIKDVDGAVSNVVTVALKIVASTSPPAAVNDSKTIDEGETVTLNVLENDAAETGVLDVKSVAIVQQPTHGTATPQPDGTIKYVHDGSEPIIGHADTDSFTYTVKDLQGKISNAATVSLTIKPTNDAPIAGDDAGAVKEGSKATFKLTANDTDVDNAVNVASITIDNADKPAHGTVVINGDGTVTYQHNGTETTNDAFKYRIKDQLGQVSNLATVNITIQPVNDPPVANDDPIVLSQLLTAPLTINVASNDTDADDELDLTSIVIVDAPSNGTVVVSTDPQNLGTLIYTLTPGKPTSDTFTYTIKDKAKGISTKATVTIGLNL